MPLHGCGPVAAEQCSTLEHEHKRLEQVLLCAGPAALQTGISPSVKHLEVLLQSTGIVWLPANTMQGLPDQLALSMHLLATTIAGTLRLRHS